VAIVRLRRRTRRGLRLTDRGTIALAAVAGVPAGGAFAIELGRVWRRGDAPLPSETDEPLVAAAEAVSETAQVVVAGYREGSPRENATFNLLVSFVASLVLSRAIAWTLRDRQRFGPFRNVEIGRRHIHHFVPGIGLAFASGAAAFVTHDERAQALLALPFGTGLGMTIDESALLLELDDVYWSPEGLVGVQIALAATALLSALVIALRFTRRGEQIVLPDE
jgi:hypothetical protein